METECKKGNERPTERINITLWNEVHLKFFRVPPEERSWVKKVKRKSNFEWSMKISKPDGQITNQELQPTQYKLQH